MRNPVRELTSRPDLVMSDATDLQTIEWAESLIAAFEWPATDDEAAALLACWRDQMRVAALV